jgi:hypothetical protein
VKRFLAKEFVALLDDEEFLHCLPAHLKVDNGSLRRVSMVMKNSFAIASMDLGVV